MKSFLIIVSIAIGICSIVYFSDRISNITASATALFTTYTALVSSFYRGELQLGKDLKSTTPAVGMSVPRAIRKAFLAIEQAEGAGARVRRSIGTPQLRNFSPFLMLDHFSIGPGAGFPDQ